MMAETKAEPESFTVKSRILIKGVLQGRKYGFCRPRGGGKFF